VERIAVIMLSVLGATVENGVALSTWHMGFVHYFTNSTNASCHTIIVINNSTSSASRYLATRRQALRRGQLCLALVSRRRI
jgi:hypothetical protein